MQGDTVIQFSDFPPLRPPFGFPLKSLVVLTLKLRFVFFISFVLLMQGKGRWLTFFFFFFPQKNS